MPIAQHLERQFPGIHSFAEKAISWRNHIHRHPELSFHEFETAAFVEKKLREYQLFHITRMAETGVIATLHEESDLPCVALRADLDALPILESSNKAIRSINSGVMHACGHDAHTACLLGAAAYLASIRSQIRHNVKFIFQPGEEKLPGGASMLIEEGVLRNPTVEAIYGLHVTPDLETGQFGLRAGPFMASTDELHLKVIGKPGHAAMFGAYINPLHAAATFVHCAMQEVIKKYPGFGSEYVLAFGAFEAKGATNVIPAEANVQGTLRTFDESLRTHIHDFLIRLSDEIAGDTGSIIELEIRKGYPVLFNNPQLTERTKLSLEKICYGGGLMQLERRMTAEDFAWYSMHVPACFIRWGTGNKTKNISASVHTPEFDIDEDAVVYGIAALIQCVMQH